MEEKAPPPSQLGNLEAFLSSSTAIASAAPSALSVTQFRAPINSGFALLQSCPSGARDAFLQLVAILVRLFQIEIEIRFSSFLPLKKTFVSRVFTVGSFQRPKTKFVFSRLMWRQRRT